MQIWALPLKYLLFVKILTKNQNISINFNKNFKYEIARKPFPWTLFCITLYLTYYIQNNTITVHIINFKYILIKPYMFRPIQTPWSGRRLNLRIRKWSTAKVQSHVTLPTRKHLSDHKLWWLKYFFFLVLLNWKMCVLWSCFCMQIKFSVVITGSLIESGTFAYRIKLEGWRLLASGIPLWTPKFSHN